MSSSLGIGVVGLGFMGRMHIRALAAAEQAGLANRLVAVGDPDPDRLRGEAGTGGNLASAQGQLFDPKQTRTYRRAEDLFADPEVEAVCLCTPTTTHVELAIAALRADKHVLVEKPLALDSPSVERLLEVDQDSDRTCMPAMCMRFWPGWDWLHEAIRRGTYGKVLAAHFQRLGARPDWGDFYRDARQSGGALFDLHVHDADFVRWCFGPPQSVSTVGTLDHMSTTYRFAEGPALVQAEGGWLDEGFPFRMRYLVQFERATADFDLARERPLELHADGRTEAVETQTTTGYDGEIRHFLQVCRGQVSALSSVEEALGLTRQLEDERASLLG